MLYDVGCLLRGRKSSITKSPGEEAMMAFSITRRARNGNSRALENEQMASAQTVSEMGQSKSCHRPEKSRCPKDHCV